MTIKSVKVVNVKLITQNLMKTVCAKIVETKMT